MLDRYPTSDLAVRNNIHLRDYVRYPVDVDLKFKY